VGKGQTITLFKSQAGKISAGYLHRKWENQGGHKMDPNAFLLSIDHKKKLTPCRPDALVTYFQSNYGPCFGPWSLSVHYEEYMNANKNCLGSTGGGISYDCFNTPVD
jgi:hypothetical protein